MTESIPQQLLYTESHEWVAEQDDGTFLVGITDHAQRALGELVYVELPEKNTTVSRGDECGVVESVKAASDIYTPLSGEIIEVNETLETMPGVINDSPYEEGWVYRIKISKKEELDDLLNPDDYESTVEAED